MSDVIESILLATDFRPSSVEAAGVVVDLATAFRSQVTVLHVREEFLTWPVSPFENQDRLAADLAARNVAVADFLVHAGPVADTIVRKASELEPDLLVIGAGEKVEAGWAVPGPIAESVIQHAPVPVLAVHPTRPDNRFGTILCPVDSSRVSRRALGDAARLARAFGSRLVVLTVVPEVSWLEAAVETGRLADARLEHETKWAAEFDAFLADSPPAGAAWDREVRKGAPHEQIAAAAADHGADLLVMGATGRTGLARVLLGSVTRRVVRQLPCSVLVVKDGAVFEEQYVLDLDAIDRLAAEGEARLTTGAAAEAAGKFRQALALDPYHAAALDGIVRAYDLLGRPAAAARYRDRADRLRARTGR